MRENVLQYVVLLGKKFDIAFFFTELGLLYCSNKSIPQETLFWQAESLDPQPSHYKVNFSPTYRRSIYPLLLYTSSVLKQKKKVEGGGEGKKLGEKGSR